MYGQAFALAFMATLGVVTALTLFCTMVELIKGVSKDGRR